jgi:RHS repeat-associated protein
VVTPSFGSGGAGRSATKPGPVTPDPSTRDDQETSTYTDVFEYGKGDHLMQVSVAPQNFKGKDGSWEEIDPNLVKDGSVFRTVAGPVKASFPEALSDQAPVSLALPEGTLTAYPLGLAGPVAATVSGNHIAYPNVAPGVSLHYYSIPTGYVEDVVLASAPSASRSSWRIQLTGLTLRLEPSGEISILSSVGAVVGILPPPVAIDSGHDAATGRGASKTFTYVIEDLGAGSYTLHVDYDTAWLQDAARVYPVTIDPSPVSRSAGAWHDTYVSGCAGEQGTNFRLDTVLKVGFGSCTYYSLLDFDIEQYRIKDRITYGASISALKTFLGSGASGDNVRVHYVTDTWDINTVNWTNKPPFGSTVHASASSAAGAVSVWDVGGLYQRILSRDWANNGVLLAADKYHEFASQEASGGINQALLQIVYNDLPDAPVALTPADRKYVSTESPTLTVTGLPNDLNSDPVWVQFQVSTKDAPDFDSGIVAQSDWSTSTEWSVDAGALKDGGIYYWRALSADVCPDAQGVDAMCGFTDANDVVHDHNGSRPRKLTVSLPKYGADERWAMSSSALGNGMTLKVNQANGNLFLDYPLDAMQTPLGPLSLSIAYNSQLAEDRGLSTGWTIGAGPLSDGTKVPVTIQRLPKDEGDAVEIVFADGGHAHIPHESGNIFRSIGGGLGMITHAPNMPAGSIAWTYITPTGGRFEFDTTGALRKAYPSTDQYPLKGYDYTFNSATPVPRITSIEDPLQRTVQFRPTSGNITTIDTWDGRSWTLTYDLTVTPARLKSIKEPGVGGAMVQFGYDSAARLSTITDGENNATTVTYYDGVPSQDPDIFLPSRARLIKAPLAAQGTLFSYTGKQTGSIVQMTTVTDPRGQATPAANDYTTWTDFDLAGLPIRVRGPDDLQNVRPHTTMVWDTNGNLTCMRSPAANAAAVAANPQSPTLKCVQTGNLKPADLVDEFNTDYEYQSKAPYKLLKVTSPAPAAGKQRSATTYGYDSGFTGLVLEAFANSTLSGQPVSMTIDGNLNRNFDTNPVAGLPANGWGLRYRGIVTPPPAADGDYYFRLTSDDGSRLMVGSSLVVDCWKGGSRINCDNGDWSAKKWLKGGRPVPFTLEYYDGTGNANVKLEWNIPGDGQGWLTVPAGGFGPNLNLLTSMVQTKDVTTNVTTTYTFPTVKRKLTGLPDQVLRGDRWTKYGYDPVYGRVTTDQNAAPTDNTMTSHYLDTTGAAGISCLDQRTDRSGAIVKYTCNQTGDITKVEVVVDAVTQTGQLAQTRVIDNKYDPLGRVTDTSLPHNPGDLDAAIKWTYTTYDKAGRVLSVKDPMQNVTDYVYTFTSTGRTMKEILPDPDGTGPLARPEVLHTYDSVGNEIERKDARGYIWKTSYDPLNRVVSQSDPTPVPNVVATVYDLNAGTVRVTDPSNIVSLTTLDMLGRTVSQRLGTLNATTYEYDLIGNALKSTDPANVYVRSDYNEFGQATRVYRKTANNGTAEDFIEYQYDKGGNVDWMADERGYKTDYTYDGEGRITQTKLPDKTGTTTSLGVTDFAYDDAGERIWVRDGIGVVRKYTYDVRGRLEKFQDPRLTTTYTYNDNAQLRQSVDSPGTTRNFEYDNLGRMTKRYGATATTDAQTFTYDPAGNVRTSTGGGYVTTVDYDEANRTKQVTQTVPGQANQVTTFTFTRSQLTQRTDVAGNTLFGYDTTTGMLNKITDPFGGTVDYTYDASTGRLLERKDAALRIKPLFDGAGRLYKKEIRKATDLPAASPFASFELVMDEASDITRKLVTLPGVTAANNRWDYAYDEAGRLVTATDGAAVPTKYGYDGASNRTSVQVGTAAATTTTYDTAGFPKTATNGTTYNVTYSVAANGNLTGMTGSRVASYTYDTWNHMTTGSSGVGGATITYNLDALGRTASRTKSGVTPTTTYYAYAGTGEDPVWTSDATGVTNFAYTPGGPLAQKKGTTTRYYITDLHGDVAGLVDTTSAVKGTRSLSPWGEQRAATGETSVLGLQGDLTDPDTGLVDMTTRNYDPQLGRFNTKDVLFGESNRPTSLNQFSYGESSPVNFSDSTGMGLVCDNPRGSGTDCKNSPPPIPPPPPPVVNNGQGPTGSQDPFQHGNGSFNVPIPVLHVGDVTVLVTRPIVYAAIRQALLSQAQNGGEVVLKGLGVRGPNGGVVVATGVETRNYRAGPSPLTRDPTVCRGLLGCVSWSEGSAGDLAGLSIRGDHALTQNLTGGCSGFLGCIGSGLKKIGSVVGAVWRHGVIGLSGCFVLCAGASFSNGHLSFSIGGFGFGAWGKFGGWRTTPAKTGVGISAAGCVSVWLGGCASVDVTGVKPGDPPSTEFDGAAGFGLSGGPMFTLTIPIIPI